MEHETKGGSEESGGRLEESQGSTLAGVIFILMVTQKRKTTLRTYMRIIIIKYALKL